MALDLPDASYGPGDPLSARDLNRLVSGVRTLAGIGGRSGIGGSREPIAGTVVQVKNTLAASLYATQVAYIKKEDAATWAQFSDPEQAAQAEPLVLQVDDTTDNLRLVVILDQIAQDGVGRALIQGVALVRINVSSESQEYAEPDSSGLLKSADTGPALVLWKEAGTGEKWGLIEFPISAGGGAELVIVQATAGGSSGAVNVKQIRLKADVSLQPNFEQVGDAFSVAYFKG